MLFIALSMSSFVSGTSLWAAVGPQPIDPRNRHIDGSIPVSGTIQKLTPDWVDIADQSAHGAVFRVSRAKVQQTLGKKLPKQGMALTVRVDITELWILKAGGTKKKQTQDTNPLM